MRAWKIGGLLAGAMTVATLATAQEGWEPYEAAEYGFSMSIPKGTAFAPRAWRNGWAGLQGEYDGVRIHGLTHRGKVHPAGEIESFGVKVTGIAREQWKTIDKGEGKKGWDWYHTVRAEADGKLFFGGYGVGYGSSFLLVLETTTTDFLAHRKAYRRWYASVALKAPDTTTHAAEFTVPGEGWQRYRAEAQGFSMMVPGGTRLEERTWEGGWAGLSGTKGGVRFWGLHKAGHAASEGEAEALGVRLTGVPEAGWEVLDEGSGQGWSGYRTVQASGGGHVVFGGYGEGPKGQYLLLLKTTEADFQAHREDYRTWYRKVKLH
jgi:hypothetical protein